MSVEGPDEKDAKGVTPGAQSSLDDAEALKAAQLIQVSVSAHNRGFKLTTRGVLFEVTELGENWTGLVSVLLQNGTRR